MVTVRNTSCPMHHQSTDGIVVHLNKEGLEISPQPMRATGELGPSVFDTLPSDQTAPEEALFDVTTLAEALAQSAIPVQTFVTSAWGQHAPFLLSLISVLRPRRYVELGTYFGMSFFSACYGARTLGLSVEAVAIDSWKGDEYSGYYDEDIFEQFVTLLREQNFREAYFIRSLFDEALRCFANSSIDLLHIDGNHSYECVKADFESWLSKMSDRGVILLHDTMVKSDGFEVWKLWQELEELYPTFNLMHTHGLGIVYVGRRPSVIADVLLRLRENEILDSAVNQFFRNIGDLSIVRNEFVRIEKERDQLAHERDKLAHERDKLAHERVALRSDLARTRAQLSAVRTSASWKLTKPYRRLGALIRAGWPIGRKAGSQSYEE